MSPPEIKGARVPGAVGINKLDSSSALESSPGLMSFKIYFK